jgi:hypothetical protein
MEREDLIEIWRRIFRAVEREGDTARLVSRAGGSVAVTRSRTRRRAEGGYEYLLHLGSGREIGLDELRDNYARVNIFENR